jgi:folate-dependent phosphoribosylglycinamide formyltransferase PurN
MKKIIILASDTTHRRYFIKKILKEHLKIYKIFFESSIISPKFSTGPFFKDEEDTFEKENFFHEFDSNLPENSFEYVDNINNEIVLNSLQEIQPDLGIVFGTRKISDRVIAKFKDGLFNIHRGIAEEYRGLDTNLWAIYHSDIENVGITIHYVNSELDTGDIIFQERIQYPKKTKIFQLRFFETLQCTELTIQAIKRYLNGSLKFRHQIKKGRYYSFMPLVLKELLPAKLEKLL